MSHTIDEQIDRLRAAVISFRDSFGRVPTVAFDADGVIYHFDGPYIEHHNRSNPHLPPIVGPFEKFDVGYGQTPEVAEALQESMRTLDWSILKPYEEARAVIPVLVEVGLDLSIATAHRVDNVYAPSAKVYQFHYDFDGYFDNRIQIGIDKTRVLADFLIDDKPEVKGELSPVWEHLRFTQHYNKDLPGIHVVWETMFEVLASVIEAKVAGRTLTPSVATVLPTSTGEQPILAEATEASPAWAAEDTDLPAALVEAEAEPEMESAQEDVEVLPITLPWADSTPEQNLEPVTEPTWDDLLTNGGKK